MKCYGSQITSTVRSQIESRRELGTVRDGSPPKRAREVAAAFNALLLGETFAPLAKAMGFYGDTVVGLAARSMARSERGGMTDRLERAIESVSERSLR